jgi:FtsP/CotA-like multicopper oxidase with cupredoxin domain
MKTLLVWLFVISSSSAFAKTVRYDLKIENKPVNLSGKKAVDFALTVNGGIPAPTLEFTEGDDAEINVVNGLSDEEVSIHWHGLLLPPEEDGVAYVNTPPIHPGQSRTFRFKIRQHGTYWYHSHTMLQEQKGVFGAFIIHPKKETIKADKEIVVVINDWTDENPDQVLRNLKKDGDYYLYKKNTVRSWIGAARAGALKTYLGNEWDRMGGMDLSDVGYDVFLINGKRDSDILTAHPGEKVRIRLINAAASSYFYVSLAGLPMKVISADGTDIEPIFTKEILIGMAETYDVLFTVPEHKNFELRATCQDGTGFASGWIGMGPKLHAPDRPMPDLYAGMDHAAMGHSSHQMPASSDQSGDSMSGHEGHEMSGHDMSGHERHSMPVVEEKPKDVIETVSVDELKAQGSTVFPPGKKIHDVKLVLGGDMERYVWFINGKTIQEDRSIPINEGDVVRFTFENGTMMHHPMHLHGHFFRVLNRNGDFSPMKHTVDVPPHGTRTIEFYANEPGEWMLHCHNLYHMKTGMARVVSYSTFTPSPRMQRLQSQDPHAHDHTYFTGSADASTNLGELRFKASQTWDTFELRAETKKEGGHWEKEGDAFYRHWFDSYLNAVAGATFFDEETRAVAGIGYLLPMLIETNLLIDSKGKGRLDLGKKFQWTSTVFSDVEVKFRDGFDPDWLASLMYANQWRWSAGLKFTDGNVGIGFQYRF